MEVLTEPYVTAMRGEGPLSTKGRGGGIYRLAVTPNILPYLSDYSSFSADVVTVAKWLPCITQCVLTAMHHPEWLKGEKCNGRGVKAPSQNHKWLESQPTYQQLSVTVLFLSFTGPVVCTEVEDIHIVCSCIFPYRGLFPKAGAFYYTPELSYSNLVV